MARKRPHYAKATRGRSKYNYFKLFSMVLILVFIVLTPLIIKKLIIIKNINCTSQYGECPNTILNGVSYVSGWDLQSAKKEIEKNLKDNYLIYEYLIQYKIPSTLELDIVIKKPKYAVKQRNSPEFFLLDKEGVFLEQNRQSNLPFVIVENFNNSLGERVNDKLLFASKINFQFNWLYSVGVGEIKNDGFYTRLKEGVVVIFPLEGDVDSLIGAIRLIYSRLNESSNGIRMENVREIDLRFKNPVIR